MKKLLFFMTALALGATMLVQHASAQNVTTNGGSGLASSYATLADAITALNAATITSPVVITQTANETAPVGGYSITQLGGTATNTITFLGGGKTITAFTPQVVGQKYDCIFRIIGGDYITIQNFIMNENAGNAVGATLATNNMTEFGIGLFAASATDGAQNNTIQGNTITLSSATAYQNAIGIFSTSASAWNNGVQVAASIAGTNSNNKFYSNIIAGVAQGFYFISPTQTATVFESGNDIGGSSAGTANTITFGKSNTAGDLAFTSYSGTTPAGVYFRNVVGNSVKYNTISSYSTLTLTCGGIFSATGTNPTGITYTTNFSNNNITLTEVGSVAVTGIDFGSGLSTGTIVGSNNTIVFNINTTAANSGTLTGIKANYASATNTVSTNTITINQSPITAGATTSAVTGVTVAGIGTTVNASSNIITFKQNLPGGTASFTSGAITFIDCSAASGTVNVLSNQLLTTGSAIRSTGTLIGVNQNSTVTVLVNIKNNTANINRISTSGTSYFQYTSGSPQEPADTISGNTITFTGLTGTQTITAINSAGGLGSVILGKSICNNSISITGTHSGTSVGIFCAYAPSSNILTNSVTISCAAPTVTGINTSGNSTTMTGNTVSLTSSSTSPTSMQGIVMSGVGAHLITNNNFPALNFTGIITASPVVSAFAISGNSGASLYQNTITNISVGAATSTGSPTVDGILISGGSSINVYKNKIYGITTACTGATTVVNGIRLSGGTSNTVYNNLIGNLSASAASSPDALRGISITSSTTSSTNNIYYNTISLSGSGGTNFGSSGIYHLASATSTTATLNLRNNIIVNNCTPSGTGVVVAFRRSNGIANMLNNYASTSDYNLFFAGVSGASNLIYYDGTSNAQTLANYQAGVFTAGTIAPRDGGSVTQNPTFLSLIGSNVNYLHIDPSVATPIESGGVNIATFTDDYDAQTRQGNPGYAGTGTSTDIGADEFNGIPSFTCTTPAPGNTVTSANGICFGQSVTLSLQNATPGNGVLYQWQSSPDGITYGNISSANSATYAFTPATSLYYQCIVTCQNGPASATSNPIQITFASNILTTTPGSRCGTGTVSLAATASGGTIKWYTASSGGSLVGSGSPWTTPSIGTTTHYWVDAETSSAGNVTFGIGSSLTSATGYPTAFGNRGYQDWSQMVYTAAELQAAGLSAGNITAITFNISAIGSSALVNNYTISMGTAPGSTLSGFTTTGLTTVYGPATYTSAAGLNLITFSVPYVWDGSSNILLDIRGTGQYLTNNATTYYTATTGSTVVYAYSSSNLPSYYTSSPTATTSTSRLNVIFAEQTALCTSPRSDVVATVNTAPVLTVTANQTICNNTVATLAVTSTQSDFDSYIWSPVTSLFTDFGCTSAYAGASATTVYCKSGTGGILNYTCAANNSGTACTNSAVTVVTNTPATPVITASPTSICVSGTTTFTTAPATGYGTATFQWQNSPDNSIFTDIAGASSLTYTTPTLTSTTYYKMQVKVGGSVCTESTATVAVNSPSVTGTTPGSRCGTGTVSLAATGTSGTTLNWYAGSSGGSSLGTGSPFTTPSISVSTNYYVSASSGGGTFSGARSAPASTSSTTPSSYGLVFDVTTPFTLNSVDVYNAGASGTMVIQLQNNAGTVLLTSGTFTVPVGTGVTPYTASLGWPVAIGTGYRLLVISGTASLVRETSLGGFPYAIGTAGSVTSGYIGGTTTTYYYLYNWSVSTGCESGRTLVAATVNSAPAITALATPSSICSGSSSSLSASSSNSGYTYAWSPTTTPATGTPVLAYPGTTTLYTVTATDNSGGAYAGCVASATATVSVTSSPPTATITPASAGIYAGSVQQLVANGGTNTEFSELFNSASTLFTTGTLSGTPTATQNTTYYAEGTSSYLFNTASTSADVYYTMTNSIDLTQIQNPVFKFSHICATEAGYDYGWVQYSTDNGATWTSFPTSSYTGTAALRNAVVSFDKSSYSDWGTQFTGVGVTPGTGPATSLWKNEMITIPVAAASSTQFKIRFRYTTDTSNNYYGWLIDNATVTGNFLITWLPTTELFTDAGATAAYAGTAIATVYAKPSVTRTYTATSTSGSCFSTKDVTVTILTLATWTGANGTNWGDNLNWNPTAVPGPSTDAVIPTGVTNMPVVNENPGTPATCYNLSIQTGTLVTVAAGKALTVNGTLSNSGSPGIILSSDATGTGSLIFSTASVSGNVQRYIPIWGDIAHGWHFLSSPVASQAIQPSFVPTSPGSAQDFYAWDEVHGYWFNSKDPSLAWVSGFDNQFVTGKGYLVAYNDNVTKTFSGTMNYSNVAISGLTRTVPGSNTGDVTPGWNLIGNPFTSAMTWNPSGVTNVASVAKIWNEGFASYTAINASDIIPATQGFMVEVTSGSGSLTLPASTRTHNSLGWYKSTGKPYIQLLARNPGAQTAQESVIMFDNQASAGYDPAFDSHFLPGYAPLFYSAKGTEHLSNIVLPDLTSQTTVPLTFIKTAGTSFSIEAQKIDNIPAQVYLTDLKLNLTQNLVDNPVYTFTAADGDDPARFLLSFSHVGTGEKTVTSSGIYSYQNNLYIVKPGKARLEVYNLTGQKLLSENIDNPGLYKTTLNVPTAYYIVRLTTGTKVVVTKVFIQS